MPSHPNHGTACGPFAAQPWEPPDELLVCDFPCSPRADLRWATQKQPCVFPLLIHELLRSLLTGELWSDQDAGCDHRKTSCREELHFASNSKSGIRIHRILHNKYMLHLFFVFSFLKNLDHNQDARSATTAWDLSIGQGLLSMRHQFIHRLLFD